MYENTRDVNNIKMRIHIKSDINNRYKNDRLTKKIQTNNFVLLILFCILTYDVFPVSEDKVGKAVMDHP